MFHSPRETYGRLARSRTIPKLEGQAILSFVCLYFDRRYRGKDLSVEFIKAAIDFARSQGAIVVEGYPVEAEIDTDGYWYPAKSCRFMGYNSSYKKAGFRDVSPKNGKRKVFRYKIK